MCVECGTPLNVSQSPQADRERAFIRREIAAGQDEGSRSRPRWSTSTAQTCSPPAERRGFDVTNWLVPVVLVLLAVAALLARRAALAPRAAGAGRRRTPPALDPEDARRLDATWRASTVIARRHRRHHGLRRVRGRLRLVHLALRAAARARLPVRGLRRLGRRDAVRRAAARRGAAARDRLLPVVHRRVRRAGDDRHRPRLDAQGPRATLDQIAGRADHRAGRLLRAHAVRAAAEPRVAAGRADARAGSGGPIIAGAAFAIAWTPCVGPTLGAILTAAATQDSVGQGGAAARRSTRPASRSRSC